MSTTDPARVPVSEAGPPADPEVLAERGHLTAARDALRAMHDDVAATTLMMSGDAKDEFNDEAVFRNRLRRLADLADIPEAPLFFGRLDLDPGTVFLDEGGEVPRERSDAPDRVHIGRRHVHDADGRPMVLDWRAPISVAYYRATASDRMRVLTRRRYGFTTVPTGSDTSEVVLTAYEDEPLTVDEAEARERTDDLLATEVERPRSGPMRDIVATIQPEQDDLVRAPLSTTLCVQGAPGTGKTAVGLHRVAYLLYTERARLSRTGVSIVGPNRSFLSYIRNVLPALGEVDVGQTTVEEMLEAGLPERSRPNAGWVRRTESPEAARIKGDARMAEVLRRDLWSHLRVPQETVMVREGSRRWRLYPEDLRPLADELAGRGVTYGAGRDLLSHRIAHAVLSLMESEGHACDDRTHERVRRDPAVRRAVTAMWPEADPLELVLGLLTDPGRLARAADGILTPEERALLPLPGKPRGAKSARWSREDLVLVDEAAALVERHGGLGHIVVDEAQDLSPMQCRAVGRRAPDGLTDTVADACRIALAGPGSVGLIAADTDLPGLCGALTERGLEVPVLGDGGAELDSARLVGVPASLAKGLEFDAVVVAEPAAIVDAEARGRNRLYVVLTRAVSTLHVVHARPLPDGLA